MATAYKFKDVEAAPSTEAKKVRLTIISRQVNSVENACNIVKKAALVDKKLGKKNFSGPVRLPTKVLRITTRKAPGGEGTNSWDRFEMRIHKRIIDLVAPLDVINHVTRGITDPAVTIEIKFEN